MYPEVINWKQNSSGFVFWITVNSVNSIQKSKKIRKIIFSLREQWPRENFRSKSSNFFWITVRTVEKSKIFLKFCSQLFFEFNFFLFLFFWIFHFFQIYCSSVNGSDPVKTGQGERRVEFWPVLRVGGCRVDGFGVGGCILD